MLTTMSSDASSDAVIEMVTLMLKTETAHIMEEKWDSDAGHG